MKIKAIHTTVFKAGEPIIPFLTKYLKKLEENSVLVITSKIIALSEKRVRTIENDHTREKIIRAESQWALKTKYTWLTIKDNMVMASAGIDESNANGQIILLPSDSFKIAQRIRNELKITYGLKNLAVLITDSRSLPLRAGIAGVTLGYAGCKGLRDYRGQADIFGRKLSFSQTNVVDSLATAAVLTMGEGAEQKPLAVITKAPVEFREKTNRHELNIDIKEDLYRPVFEKINKIKWKK